MQIAKMNAMLTATAEGFAATFAAASKAASSFEGKIASVAGGIAAYEIGKSVAEAAFRNTVGLVEHQLQAVDSTAKLSDSLGIATKSLSQLQYAASYAGASTEDLSSGLTKMNKNLSDATEGQGEAGRALDQLGLSAKDLLNTPADQRIGKIADALNSVANPAQRAADAQQIFGKGAISLMPLLAEGSAGLAKMASDSDKLGYSFDRVDAAQIEAANDAITKVENVLTGVATQLAIKLAPFIEAAADKLSSMGTAGDGMASHVVDAFEEVVKAVAVVTDYFQLAKAGWKLFEEGVTRGIQEVVGALDKLGHAVSVVAGWFGAKVDTTFLDSLTEELGKSAAKLAKESDAAYNVFKDGDTSKKVGEYFDKIRAGSHAAGEATAKAKESTAGGLIDPDAIKGVEKATATIAQLQKQVDQFNETKGQKAADDIAAAGGNAQQQQQAKELSDRLDALDTEKKAHEDAQQAAQKYYDDTRTAAEKYSDEIARINKLVTEGALDQDTAQRARDKAQTDYDNDAKGANTKSTSDEGPKLLQAGSQDAAQFIAQMQRRGTGESDQKQLVKGQASGNKLLEQLVKNTSNGGQLKLATI